MSNQTITVTITLESGEYMARELSVFGRSRFVMDVNVRDGGPVDVYTMTESQFDEYSGGENIQYIGRASEEFVRSERIEGILAGGDYVMVFDNTPAFGAEPDGRVVIDVQMGLFA